MLPSPSRDAAASLPPPTSCAASTVSAPAAGGAADGLSHGEAGLACAGPEDAALMADSLVLALLVVLARR
jgi:hypothetical protein